jgi:hypothetical protein
MPRFAEIRFITTLTLLGLTAVVIQCGGPESYRSGLKGSGGQAGMPSGTAGAGGVGAAGAPMTGIGGDAGAAGAAGADGLAGSGASGTGGSAGDAGTAGAGAAGTGGMAGTGAAGSAAGVMGTAGAGGAGQAGTGGASGTGGTGGQAGAGGNPDGGTDGPPPGCDCMLKVQYECRQNGASVLSAEYSIKVVNTGTKPIALNTVSVRYWYTIDGTGAQAGTCASTAHPCTIAFQSPSTNKPMADQDAVISFASGTLAPGADTGEIAIQFNGTGPYTQTNDYSFSNTGANFLDAMHITAYVSGKLLWGTPP